jgi:hypothetical protein
VSGQVTGVVLILAGALRSAGQLHTDHFSGLNAEVLRASIAVLVAARGLERELAERVESQLATPISAHPSAQMACRRTFASRRLDPP